MKEKGTEKSMEESEESQNEAPMDVVILNEYHGRKAPWKDDRT